MPGAETGLLSRLPGAIVPGPLHGSHARIPRAPEAMRVAFTRLIDHLWVRGRTSAVGGVPRGAASWTLECRSSTSTTRARRWSSIPEWSRRSRPECSSGRHCRLKVPSHALVGVHELRRVVGPRQRPPGRLRQEPRETPETSAQGDPQNRLLALTDQKTSHPDSRCRRFAWTNILDLYAAPASCAESPRTMGAQCRLACGSAPRPPVRERPRR